MLELLSGYKPDDGVSYTDILPIGSEFQAGYVNLDQIDEQIIKIARDGYYKTNIIVPENKKVYFEVEYLTGNIILSVGLADVNSAITQSPHGNGYQPVYYSYTHSGSIVANNRTVRYFYDTQTGSHFYKIGSNVITAAYESTIADNPLKRNLRFANHVAGQGWGTVKIKLRSEEFIYGPDEPGFVPLWDVLNKP